MQICHDRANYVSNVLCSSVNNNLFLFICMIYCHASLYLINTPCNYSKLSVEWHAVYHAAVPALSSFSWAEQSSVSRTTNAARPRWPRILCILFSFCKHAVASHRWKCSAFLQRFTRRKSSPSNEFSDSIGLVVEKNFFSCALIPRRWTAKRSSFASR